MDKDRIVVEEGKYNRGGGVAVAEAVAGEAGAVAGEAGGGFFLTDLAAGDTADAVADAVRLAAFRTLTLNP